MVQRLEGGVGCWVGGVIGVLLFECPFVEIKFLKILFLDSFTLGSIFFFFPLGT